MSNLNPELNQYIKELEDGESKDNRNWVFKIDLGRLSWPYASIDDARIAASRMSDSDMPWHTRGIFLYRGAPLTRQNVLTPEGPINAGMFFDFYDVTTFVTGPDGDNWEKSYENACLALLCLPGITYGGEEPSAPRGPSHMGS